MLASRYKEPGGLDVCVEDKDEDCTGTETDSDPENGATTDSQSPTYGSLPVQRRPSNVTTAGRVVAVSMGSFHNRHGQTSHPSHPSILRIDLDINRPATPPTLRSDDTRSSLDASEATNQKEADHMVMRRPSGTRGRLASDQPSKHTKEERRDDTTEDPGLEKETGQEERRDEGKAKGSGALQRLKRTSHPPVSNRANRRGSWTAAISCAVGMASASTAWVPPFMRTDSKDKVTDKGWTEEGTNPEKGTEKGGSMPNLPTMATAVGYPLGNGMETASTVLTRAKHVSNYALYSKHTKAPSLMQLPETSSSRVRFTRSPRVWPTYSAREYDRSAEVTWRLTIDQARAIAREINEYKQTEMYVHVASVCHTRFHSTESIDSSIEDISNPDSWAVPAQT